MTGLGSWVLSLGVVLILLVLGAFLFLSILIVRERILGLAGLHIVDEVLFSLGNVTSVEHLSIPPPQHVAVGMVLLLGVDVQKLLLVVGLLPGGLVFNGLDLAGAAS